MEIFKKHYFQLINKTEQSNKIVVIEAIKNYSIIHFEDGTSKKSGYTLLKFEKLLDDSTNFVRIHRAYLVNMNFTELINLELNTFTVINGRTLNISRRKKSYLIKYLKKTGEIPEKKQLN